MERTEIATKHLKKIIILIENSRFPQPPICPSSKDTHLQLTEIQN